MTIKEIFNLTYQVIIPSAGIGSRLKNETKFINKSMVEVNHKPTISHIIEKFPLNSEFIIPVGYKGKILQNYLEIAHPDLNITTKCVKRFEGPGTGLGLTLLEIFKYIDKPFVFVSADTIVIDKIPSPDKNWIGYSKVIDNSEYRTLDLVDGKVNKINNKLNSDSKNAYIGLAGVKDYERFKEIALENKEEFITLGESLPISKFVDKFKPIEFNWLDTGNVQKLNFARQYLQRGNKKKFNILDKENEKIWFVNEKVIKFSIDEKFIKERIQRNIILESYVPKIINHSKNMYSYKFQEGEILSEVIDEEKFIHLLSHLENFWDHKQLNEDEQINFYQNCYEFYKDKSFDRFDKFSLMYPYTLRQVNLNGNQLQHPLELLNRIDWKNLSYGVPVNFHGDLHFENILYSDKGFNFLDWRQSFNNLTEYGDIYYDLAKILHGILLPHHLVKSGEYSIYESEDKVSLEINLTENTQKYKETLKNWVIQNNLDFYKVELITALIFINIAPLHHHPYSKFLFYYGLEQLNKILSDEKN